MFSSRRRIFGAKALVQTLHQLLEEVISVVPLLGRLLLALALFGRPFIQTTLHLKTTGYIDYARTKSLKLRPVISAGNITVDGATHGREAATPT